MRNTYLFLMFLVFSAQLFAQNTDKASYKTYPSGFYFKQILRDNLGDEAWAKRKYQPREVFKMEMQDRIFPTDLTKYTTVYHLQPVSQGNSGTCWAYSAISFLESEVYRMTSQKIKLSEIYIAYWEYVERAEDFIKTKGETFLGEGSESNAVLRIMKNHGLMPLSAYSGLKDQQNFNNHEALFEQYETYLNFQKQQNSWNKTEIMDSIYKILDYWIGTPPDNFNFEGKNYTPQTFMSEKLKLKPNNYFSFMSTKEIAYNQKGELVEDDNWWHCKDYYNISLNDFMSLINTSIENGYSISICGDVSEPGICQIEEVAIIPDFDIPSAYINEDARQMRLISGATTDDHCVHLVGYQIVNGEYWYLIKDSGAGAFDGKNKGYRFFHEDYVKLKMMNILLNVEPARSVLDKIIK